MFLIIRITVGSVMEAIKKDPTISKEEATILKDNVVEGQRIDTHAIRAEMVSELVWSL